MAVPRFGSDPARSRAQKLAAVERSPHAAAAHDRAGWVGLFTADGRIEDPVGSRPHRGRLRIGRFYDTFIGPRDIAFQCGVDVVSGSTVVRDLVLDVRMGPSVTMHIPAYLRYDLDEELNLVRLRAYWELPAMVWRFARNGPAAAPAALALGRALLRNQGPAGAVGFLSGFTGVGRRGKRCLAALLEDARTGDVVAVRRRLTDAETITRGAGDRIATTELVALLSGARCDGMIAAGHSVVTRVVRDGHRSVLFAELDTHPMRIREVRVFAEHPPA